LTYPFAEAVASFDAVAPMIYWLGTNPLLDLDWAFAALRGFGKPILPIGQAYDGAADGGPPGVPDRATIQAFMAHAEALGAVGVSFWSWQGANDEAFAAIRDAPEFILPVGAAGLAPGQLRCYQVLLTSLGYPAPPTGAYDATTRGAVLALQHADHLAETGVIDAATRTVILTPRPPPVHPMS
jgi:hypothetical protein